MLRKIRSRRIIASVVVLLMLFATTGLVTAGSVTDWDKTDSGSANTITVNDPLNFVVIKQSTAAVIWTKTDLSEDEKEDLIALVKDLDSSIKNSVGDNIFVTSDSEFSFNDFLEGNNYKTTFTVNADKTKLTLTEGGYSHYSVGTYNGNYELTVEKVWSGEGDDSSARPASVTINLLKGGEFTGKSVTLNAANEWMHAFAGLTSGTYTVKEISVEGYDVDYSDSVTLNKKNTSGKITVTNTKKGDDPDPDDFDLTVVKVWKDANGDPIDPPGDTSVTINVLKGGEETDLSVTFPQDDATPWSHTFEGLEEGEYSVDEVTVPSGFSVTTSANVFLSTNLPAGTITVTNTQDGDEPNEDEPELTITKSVTPASRVGSSGTFTYTLVVRYNGEGMLYDAEVKDVFSGPAGATYNYGNITFNPNEEGYSFHEESGIFNLGDMEDGDVITITYTVDITGLGTHNNTATVSGTLESQEPMSDEDDA